MGPLTPLMPNGDNGMILVEAIASHMPQRVGREFRGPSGETLTGLRGPVTGEGKVGES